VENTAAFSNESILLNCPMDWGKYIYVFDPMDSAYEIFVAYSDIYADKRFAKKAIRRIENVKAAIENVGGVEGLIAEDANLESIIASFVGVAEVFFPNRKNKKAITLLEVVLRDRKSLESYYPPSPDEVQIMTFHKSKGLEFDLVFHLDLYEYILPRKTWNNGKAVFPDLHQAINLHYVATTRAKEACVLVHSTQRHNYNNQIKNGNPSEFLSANQLSHLKTIRRNSIC